MSIELAKTYAPKDVEPQVLAQWNDTSAFHATPVDRSTNGKPYCIVIPPPNVTAALHMGHALNNTIQDILIRWRRMMGDNAVWIPGTDHAGIATQTVVEKRVLREEGKKRTDFARDEFVAKIQKWKDEYEQTILGQLKAMGCSCDWDRTRFTMDEVCAAAVREAFFKLFADGLIYRGKRLVNWDPVTQTALADDEVEMEEVDGQFYYLRYPLSDGSGFVTVATTRPETMLGDTAVAINPKDPRAAALRGKSVTLPIVNRVIPIVEDDYVVLPTEHGGDPNDSKATFATGFLKVTPAHDENDWQIGLRHKLPVINVFSPTASISVTHGWPEDDAAKADAFLRDALVGKDRVEARKAIVRWFKEHELFESQKPYKHSVGHSYRSHVPIEPYLSDQWYVKVTDERLAGAALRAMAKEQLAPGESPGGSGATGISGGTQTPGGSPGAKWEGGLRFHPPRYAKTFQNWHENIRDWCISRQLWWGHRIPVWVVGAKAQIIPPGGEILLQFMPKWLAEGRVAEISRATREQFGDSFDDMSFPNHFVCVRNLDDTEVIKKLEQHGYTQDPDVLDTWFSSALWPFSTLGWPDPTKFPAAFPDGDALAAWNPGNVLCTAREIITLWVSRMVMTNLYLRDCLPFTDVFIHAMIQDGEGQKMSKSLGNGVDPLDIIHSHGSDAMRFTLAAMTTQTQDVRMPVSPVCPKCSKSFTPAMVTVSGGYKVMAPTAACTHCGQKMVTSYGLSQGEAVTTEIPGARNTSEKFDYGRNFTNKLWNAVRFALANIEQANSATTPAPGNSNETPAPEKTIKWELSLPDKWILSRLASVTAQVNTSLAQYEFSNYAQVLYDFVWRDLCDWYIEAVKPVVGTPAGHVQRRVLEVCIDASLRMLHPAMPFVTEKLWESLNDVAPVREISGVMLVPSGLLIHAKWPVIPMQLHDDEAEREFELVRKQVSAIREVRTTYKVPPRQRVLCTAKAPGPIAQKLLEHRVLVETLANMEAGEIGPGVEKPAHAAGTVVGDVEIYIHNLVEAVSERDRLSKRLDEVRKSAATLEGRLANKSYIDRAPANLVQQTRDQLASAQREAIAIEQQLASLA
jgi:valyl-tRNA synthetase